jgi:hypothetical protein
VTGIRKESAADNEKSERGDIDSPFLYSKFNNINGNLLASDLINECGDRLKIDIEHEKIFKNTIALKKKHYI